MRLSSLVQMVLLGAIWGSSYLFIRIAVDGISPFLVVASRLFFGAVLLFAVVLIWRLALPRDRMIWLHLTVMAIIGNAIPWSLISWAGQHIDSGLSATLNSTTPLFTIVFTVAAFKSEQLSIPRVIGVLLGFTGVAVLTGAGTTDLASASLQAQLAVLLSSICYGLSFAYARRYISGNPIVLAGCQILIAFLIVTPFAILFGSPLDSEVTFAIAGSVVALGVLTSGVAYVLYYRLIRDVGATMASYATFLIPIVGLILGRAILNESIHLRSILGVVFILSGLAVATTFHRNPAPAALATPEITPQISPGSTVEHGGQASGKRQ